MLKWNVVEIEERETVSHAGDEAGTDYKNRWWDEARRLIVHPTIRLHMEVGTVMEVVESCNQTLSIGMSEESLLELSKALDSVRVPDGVSPLQVAFETAKLQPLKFKSRFGRLRNYNPLFLSFCYYLQVSLGKEAMPLSEDAIARVFGCSQKTVSNYRVLAEREGFLVRVSDHCHYPGTSAGLAAKFRFSSQPKELVPSSRGLWPRPM